MSEYGIVALPSPSTCYPTINLNLPPHIKYQMEEFNTVIFDRVQNLVAKTLIASDLITHATKQDTFRTSTDIVLQNHKSFSYEFIASSSRKQDHLEETLAYVDVKQEGMYAQLKTVIDRQDDMGYDIKDISELLKHKPQALGFRKPFYFVLSITFEHTFAHRISSSLVE